MMSDFLKALFIAKNALEASSIKKILKDNVIKKVKLTITTTLAEALTHLNKNNPAIDVILLTLKPSNLSDIELFRQINTSAPMIPIIIIAETQDEAITNLFIAEGAQDFFLKEYLDGNLLAQAMAYSIERKHHEQLLNEYAFIVEHSADAIFNITPNGLIKNWNKAAESIYQYSAKEIIGQSFLLLIQPEHQKELHSLLKTLQTGSSISNYETILLTKSGKHVDSMINISPIRNKLGAIIGNIVLSKNYTHQKLSILQSAIQLRVASILAESTNLHHATQGILKVICEALEFSAGEIWALDSEERVLHYVANWSQPTLSLQLEKMSQDIVFHLNEGLPGYIWAKKKAYWNNNLKKEGRSTRSELLLSLGMNSCFGFPIIFDNEVFGVFLFYGIDVKEFDISLMIIFEIIGKQIGNFFKHRRMEEELLHLAQHDALTGLVNKFYTEKHLNTLINTAKQDHTMVAFLYFDLDNFKLINDSLGHPKGDLLLQEIAHRVQQSSRDGDIISRFGGDEFAVVLPGITKREHIDVIANKILEIIEQPFIFNKKEYYITASMGISIYPDNGDNIEMLFKSADLSMYKAKRSGRNNYQYASIKQELAENQLLRLTANLHKAFNNNEFILYYQPIVDLKTNKIVSMEALIRWKTPAGKIVTPEVFIPQLEETNFILKVGLWVIKTACHQMKLWETSGFHSVSVNISVRQLNAQLISIIKNTLTEMEINPQNLILEITESMLMQQTYIALDILGSLETLGVNISIDDFGTGYSSFAYLKNFRLQFLKIDKSFISDLHESERSKSIVTAIILMAHALGLKTIAEGVETKEQLTFLKEKKCDMYQGYYFSHPLPPQELEKIFFKQ